MLLFKYKKIFYDMLWILFKSDMLVYMICLTTDLLRCVKYNFNEEKKTAWEINCFEIQNCYFDFDDKIFNEATETLQIEMFYETKQIESLSAYSLHYHFETVIKKHFVENNHKFIFLMSCHYHQYEENMFILNKNQLIK